MTSSDLFARAVRVMPGGNTRSTLYIPPVPPYAASGEGAVVRDVDGHEVLDLHGNYTALVHGNGHPVIGAAVSTALADGACFGLPTRHDVALAERICARVPAVERVRFTTSGSEAVMMALRTARAFTGRTTVLRFAGSYHGNYDGVLDLGARGLTPGAASELLTVPVGDGKAFAAAVTAARGDLAAVILDLMPNRAGLRPLDPAFVALVRDVTATHDVLLVVDEVITLRLGVGGMQERYGLRPDLVTMGKVIGGGLAVGAWGGREDVMAVLDPREPGALAHAGTFSANPLSAAAGTAALDLLDEPTIARLNAYGDDLRKRVAALGYAVSGSGSLFRLLDLNGAADWWRLYRGGLLVGGNGLCALSTVMGTDTVDELERRFAAARGPG